jgi:hypothetical protein
MPNFVRSAPLSVRLHAAALTLLALAGAPALSGCDDEGTPVVADAGPDAGLPQCRPADCGDASMPLATCSNGRQPVFTCARRSDQRCVWMDPRCPNDDEGDAGLVEVNPSDAGDALDAVSDLGTVDAPADSATD